MKVLAFFTLITMSISALAGECVFNRAAFDVGSGTTRMKVAKVDVCKKRILNVLLEEKIPLKFMDYLGRNNTKILGEKIQKKALKVFEQLKAKAEPFNIKDYIGVGTAALRKAINGPELTLKIYNKLGIKINIINQKKEAEIGYYAALSQGVSGFKMRDIIVWDIGGGSMQISNMNLFFKVYMGQFASVPFKNWLIKNVKKQDPKMISSPNPLTQKQMLKGVAYVQKKAINEVPYNLKRTSKSSKKLMIGIGAVHNYSILKHFPPGTKEYSAADLKKLLSRLAGKTDRQIGGKYAATDFSNVGLVLGFMQGLGFEKVQVRNVNMTDGLLISPKI